MRMATLMHNTMLADRLALFTAKRVSFALTPNQSTNTIGVGAQFNIAASLGATAPRPQWIGESTVTPVGDTIDYPLVPFASRDDYFLEPQKGITDLWPQRFLYEPEWLNGKFTWWPVPTTAAVVNLGLPVPLTAPATADTDLSFPPGYLEYWTYSLAKRLCVPYRRKFSDEAKELLRDAKGLVFRNNDFGPPVITLDRALTGGGGYDIRSNQNR